MITLKIQVDEKELEMTLETARRIYNELHTLFSTTDPYSFPIVPSMPETFPYYPKIFYKLGNTCGG